MTASEASEIVVVLDLRREEAPSLIGLKPLTKKDLRDRITLLWEVVETAKVACAYVDEKEQLAAEDCYAAIAAAEELGNNSKE